jgi:hypothetical protein
LLRAGSASCRPIRPHLLAQWRLLTHAGLLAGLRRRDLAALDRGRGFAAGGPLGFPLHGSRWASRG